MAIAVAVGLFIASSSSSPIAQMQRLSARLDSLKLIIDEGTKNVKNGDLRKVQSDASILVAGDISTVKAAMQTAGIGKTDKAIAALEVDTATLETLTDARLNGRFDDAYKKALSQKLENTMALMREVHDKTNSRALKVALSKAYDNFGSLLDQLSKL